MHQKLSDLIFTLEGAPKHAPRDIYEQINKMDYRDYVNKYLVENENETCDDLSYETSLNSISNYLESADNYKIYHSVNDYLANGMLLKRLKQASKDKMTLIDNGAHLGFLYRKEFMDDLKIL